MDDVSWDDEFVCEACKSQQIMVVHEMTHPDYPGVMRVGCDCAGNMQRDYARPELDDVVRAAACKRGAAFKRGRPRREKEAAFKKWVNAFAPERTST